MDLNVLRTIKELTEVAITYKLDPSGAGESNALVLLWMEAPSMSVSPYYRRWCLPP